MLLSNRNVAMPAFLLVFLQCLLLISGSSAWPWNGNDVPPQKIKPRVTRPSGPTNVTLYVVSRTELGVTWDPPIYDGGKAISKYLVEWDNDKYMTGGIVSPSNPYENNVDGPLVRSEVVWGKTQYRITGLTEGQKYYVRVSAYGDGYSKAISTNPQYAIPSIMLPGYLTDVSLSIATDTETADRLRIAWSAAEVDVNGFSVLPNGCPGGESPPSSPDAIDAYRVQWDTHPSFSNAKTIDIPAVSGDGNRNHCCPSGASGVCHVELGAEVQTVSIAHPDSTLPSSEDLFDSGSIRIAYVGSQSKSIKIETPSHGDTAVTLSPSSQLPVNSPINVGDIIRINGNVYLISSVNNWPEYIELSSEYEAVPGESLVVQAYFSTPPSTCFDLSGLGNSAENFRSHIAQNFDNSPFDESITVSRSTLTQPFSGSTEQRIVGYEYHVTFIGQGFSSSLGHPVDDLIIISEHPSPFSSVGSCGDPFVSAGIDVSSQVSLQVSTKMDSGSISPGQRYYVQVSGVNSLGAGPFVTSTPGSEMSKSLLGLAQKCRIYAVPTSSSSLKVEWDGVLPYHGQYPNSYRVDVYDVDDGSQTPVNSIFVNDIDESSKYSITVHEMTPGARYKALVTPITDLGEGSPSWFADFDPSGLIHDDEFSLMEDYIEQSCHAVPTCQDGLVECLEAEGSSLTIIARSVPPPPRMEVGTYPNVSNKNRFSSDSILASFASPLVDANLQSTGKPTDKFRLEWSTDSSFRATSLDGSVSLWSIEVPASYSDVVNKDAFGEYLIDSLTMGKQYYVRVFAHNSAGYGSPSITVPIKPMARPDPPYEPILSSVSLQDIEPTNGLSENAIIGTSLYVSWQPPRIDSSNGRPDLVGNGGDSISSYLVEWSRISFDNYNPTMVEIIISTSGGIGGSSAVGLLSGSFRLAVDTTITAETAVRDSHLSASIPVDSSAAELKTIIENMPNVGEVNVHASDPFTWILTFDSEVGDIGVSVGENDIEDDLLLDGLINIDKLGTGSIPANAGYGFKIIDNLKREPTSGESIHFTIPHLVPGMQLFTRVSAANQVGFGPRRKTAPEFISPVLQRPEQPVSLYNDEAAPYLSVHSPTSLEVHIGPSSFDGGSPLTSFLIEWDLSPTFSSSTLNDGSSLGSARVNAASLLCDSCVSDFELSTNKFSYNGDEVTAKLLLPQRKIMVFFSDDDTYYQFFVTSATATTITVSDRHLRVASLQSMKGKNGGEFSNLKLMGAKYIIDNLVSEKTYYVRVSSENGLGTGKSIATMPYRETPRGFPHPPHNVQISVKDKNSLELSWSDITYQNNPEIQAFKIECFCRSDAASTASFSFFGEQEVVEFSSIGLGISGGTFTVYFGDLDISSKILGHAEAVAGLSYIETVVDMTPHLDRGESILIGSEEYTVHPTEPFTPSRLPLSESYSGNNDESIIVRSRSKSMPISFDASALELQNALEQMPHINHVHVRREVVEGFDGYQWFVTFTSNVGPQPVFSVDATFLIGTNPIAFSTTRTVTGILPHCYFSEIVDPNSTSLELQGLVTGKPYYVRMSSVSDTGESSLIESTPKYLTPGGSPDAVSLPLIRSLNENTLLVSFEAPLESNGAVIDKFVVESSRNPGFSNSTRIEVQPDYRVQRISTRAHSMPWDENSSFTLSLGDFHGDFIVPIGSGTTVRVTNGDNILERFTGTVSLSSFAARGDFILVGGMEFRVCLSTLDTTPYDDTHLSLCSIDNAYETAAFISNSVSSSIEELPVFRLDTSLGAAMSPTVGDIYLSTVNVLGFSQDARNKLRRGDLIRVGHPEFGETFRVSTDEAREFDDRVIPLGRVEDSSAPASLSHKSLQHSSYEVQSFAIRSNFDSVVLTPSNTLNSGYRIRFKSETTHGTEAAGSNGCLKWDGSAAALKEELESLAGIDSVDVTRQPLSAIPGGVGSGVKYLITFTGDNVRGNVPPLQIVDVGINGCLDATDLGGTFKNSLAAISVEQVEIPYIPLYEVQTTVDIPYDASAEDVRTAIESLSQACTVTVSRVSKLNGYLWDVTFLESKESTQSPLLVISVNGENMMALVDPQVSAIGLQNVEVTTTVQGAPYFIRVAAVNSFGTGPFALSNPRAMQPTPQPPSGPVDVFVEAMSDSEILVQWNPPIEIGGRPVTHYKVEYDALSTFASGANGGPYGSVSVSSSTLSKISDVQSVTVKVDNGGTMSSRYLSGTFSLNYNGQNTGQLPYNASPDDMKEALEELCTIEEVSVSRFIHCSSEPSVGCMRPEGYTWLVTFVSVHEVGDQHRRLTSSLSSSYSHKLSVDGAHLFECTDMDQSLCSIGGRATASVGSNQEIQQIVIGSSSSFTVTVGGETSDVIEFGDSLSDIEEKVNAYSLNGIGKVYVTCLGCDNTAINQGDSILLHFVSYRGDLPPVTVSDPSAVVSEIVKGSAQFVVGSSSYTAKISGLTSLNDWYIRVFAYNGIGEGPPSMAWPSPLRLAPVAPQAPQDVTVSLESATSLAVSWDRPNSIGDIQLAGFIIEYDTTPSFTSRWGSALGQVFVTSAEADKSIGMVIQAYPDSSDPILRPRIIIDDSKLISDGSIQISSELVIEGQHLTVSSICGANCLSMDRDFTGASSSGMEIYSTTHTKHYGSTIRNLVPGQAYYIRVASASDKATGSFALAGGPLGPISSTPMDIPTAISWASVTSIDSDKLRVDFGTPLNEKHEGVNGSPISKYQVDIATIEPSARPEIVALTTQAVDGVSGFMEVSAGYQAGHNKMIAAGNEPATFSISPGSRWVDTNGVNLQSWLFPGELILIEEELVEVSAVYNEGFEIKEYHVRGTGNIHTFGYRMDNYIGAATVSDGDTALIDISGQNLESLVMPGDYISVQNSEFSVQSVSGSSINVTPSYSGITITAPIYARKKAVIRANASSAEMKKALESLPDIGSAIVTREGPNSSDGYTWYLTFTSNTGAVNLLTGIESISYISVSDAERDCNGNFMATSFLNGRHRYELLGKSCSVFFDAVNSEWRLYSGADSLLASVAVSSIIPPTSSWSNGVTVILSYGTPVVILHGQEAVAEVSVLQSSIAPLFENIVFSADIAAGEREIQEVEISSADNDLGGSFELTLQSDSARVTVYFDDSVDDLTTKLQSLPGVGRIHVESMPLPFNFGHTWSITFLSNPGDVPLLQHFGTSSLRGSGVALNIREVVKGGIGDHHIIADNLDAGLAYAVRVRAVNEHGYGPYTTSSQTLGSGVHPITRIVTSSPGRPSITAGRVTKSRAELKFSTPPSYGSDITSYKFEWSTSTSFNSLTQAHVRVACNDGSDILGSFKLVYGSDVASRSEQTTPIFIGSDTEKVKQSLDSLLLLREVEVASTIENSSELQWAVTFLHDVGNTGLLSLDPSSIRCQSEAEAVESSVTMVPSIILPTNYGSRELFADDNLCGSVYLAESSNVQYLTLYADSGAVSSGSYQLMLDDESTICIPHNASEEQLKTAIEDLAHVKLVEVTRTLASSEAGFPYTYKISFIGSYAYGDWPALTVNQSQFGAGSCDPFVGGSSHKATILPVRDESLCTNGIARSVAIVADALSTLGGSFNVQFGTKYSPPIRFDTSASEMESILRELTGISDIQVSKHSYRDFNVGMAWAITFPRQTNDDDIFRVVDTHVTGKNSRVDVYPILKISSHSSKADSVGDFRILLDGESTAPLSHRATNKKLLRELHRHNGIGKVNMLGPEVTENTSPLKFNALIDDSFTVSGMKAIAVVGDLTTTIAPGDTLALGGCTDLEIESIEYQQYDELQGAGYLYESLYSTSSHAEEARSFGYSVLVLASAEGDLSFTSDCSQADGAAEQVFIGSVLMTQTGVDHSVVVKAHLADLDTIQIVPESNWRGTSARLFFQPPSGLLPQTFILDGLDKTKTYIVRASAKNSEGFGTPSNILQVKPASTVPSAPISVSLS